MHRRHFIKTVAATTIATATGIPKGRAATIPRPLPPTTPAKLPPWHGFNLLEKFVFDGANKPFSEQDFQWMAAWGFDFARLPMDYRCWAKTPDADFNEAAMRDIDQAIEFGRQTGIHINLNFHRAPGYCVNAPAAENILWHDTAMQEQFARHWGIFAARYKGIPASRLSFDLVNEPPAITGVDYTRALRPAIAAIQAADPARLIIADGVNWGTRPVEELIPLGIAQSTRGYEPMRVSHYRASWIHQDVTLPPPEWPVPASMNDHIYCDSKPDLKTPLILKIDFPTAVNFAIRIGQVSAPAELIVKADGKTVLQKQFTPTEGPGEWKSAKKNQYGGIDAFYDVAYTATIPAGTREISIEGGTGDWFRFQEITLDKTTIRPESDDWGIRQEAYTLDADGKLRPIAAHGWQYSKETLWKTRIEPWQKLAAQGVGVHVGEWGCYNQTPHPVALAWMRDCLENWKNAGFGWSLWNLRGSFGIMDSDRKDVTYEDFQGHKLDRQMLNLLRKYITV